MKNDLKIMAIGGTITILFLIFSEIIKNDAWLSGALFGASFTLVIVGASYVLAAGVASGEF